MRTRKRIVSLLLAVVMIFGSLGNSIIAETIPSDTLTEPMATETSLEIEQDQPHETEPLPTEPAPTEPAPTEPAPTEPAPTEPAATEPAATEPLVTEPLPTEPQATESEANDPVVTEPAKEAPLETKAPEAEETKPELLKDLYIFYVDGVEADRQDVTHGDLLEFPELKSREPDFTFEGWFIAGLDTSLDPTKPIAVDTGGQVIEVRAVFTKVEPEPVDEEAYGPQVPYAPVLLPGSMSRMARSFSTMAAASTHEVDASTPDASLAAGQFKLSKSAALVPGKVNEWDVTLRVTGRQSETYSDIVLVIDRSGSMAGNKLTQAKAAANLFIDTVLSMPNTRIAVVSYSDSITRHGSAPYFSSNAATLKGYVNSLSANGFTHTQGGLRAAREILGNHALSGARKTIVLLSDGLPNRSYEGSGSAAVTAAIGEANAARSNGYSVYAIGLMLDASGQSTMMSIGDTGKYYYTDNPANLTPIFLAIAGSISSAVTAATVTDPMASGFIIADTGTITKTGASSTANYDSGTLTWTFPSLTQPTGTVNVLYEEVKYRIVITEDTPFASGSMPANGATPMNFTDASGASSTNYFPIPEVDPVFVTLDKILLDVNGESVSSTESFTVNIGGTDYAVTPNDPVKVIKKVWTVGDHDVTEDPSVPPYITAMTVNGLPAGGSLTVKINMSQDGPDQDIEVTNRENTAKITFGGTKTLSGRTGTTPADTFDFTLSGEAGAKMPAQTTASLTFNGNGTKDFSFGDVIYNLNDLAGENSKTFTYTIAETVPNPGIPGIVYDANPSRTVTVTLSKDLQTGILSATATPDVKFANRYQAAGSIVLTTKKVLDGRPLEAGDFTFQLKTGNLVLQTKTNAADGSVEFDPIQFSLSAVNMTFDYTIEEVAGTETGMSYDPLPITVSVEVTDPGDGILEVTPTYSNKTTFSNTYEAAGEVILSAIKLLEGRDLTAGAFTFKLMEGANELQTKTNAADGSITFDKLEFTEADIGKTFTYNIVEVAGSEAGMTYDPLVLSVSIQVTDAGNGNLLVVPTYSPTDKTFRNRYESPRINITGNKVWEDGPQDRPDIWFKLYRQIGDGVAEAVPGIDALQIPDTAPFTVTWMGVAEKNTEGVAYTFSVREGIWNEGAQVFTLGAPSGYEIAAGQDPLEITNRYIIPKDDVTATKVWEDGPSDRPDVWFKLYRQIGEGVAEAVPGIDPLQIPAAAPFTVTWTDLEQENSAGVAYTFSVREGTWNEGTQVFALGAPTGYEIEAGEDPLEITNRYIIPKDDVTATKVWQDGPSDRPDVWFKLYRQVGMGAEEAVPGIDPLQVPETEPFTVQWTDVDMENSAGEAYTFFVKEGIYDGTDFAEGAPTGYQIVAGQNPLEIINRYIIPKDDVTATKVWVNGPSDRPDIWFKLYRQVGEGAEEAVPGIDALQIPATAPFTVTWTDVELETSAGEAYLFSVKEGIYDGTDFVEGVPEDYELSLNGLPLTLTNSYVIPLADVTANKLWADDFDDHPSIWFKLYRAISGGDPEEVPGAGLKMLASGETSATWTDLEQTDIDGNPYTFSVEEVDETGAPMTPENYEKTEDGLTVQNRLIDPIGRLTVTKALLDNSGTNGGEGAADATLGEQLTFEFKVTGPYGFETLFELAPGDSHVLSELFYGEYVVEELTSHGYVTTYGADGGVAVLTEEVPEADVVVENLHLTDPDDDPNLVTVDATKTWIGGPESDHEQIVLTLYRQSGEDGSVLEAAASVVVSPDESVDGKYTYTWEGLPKHDAKGYLYTYTVEESDLISGALIIEDRAYVASREGNDFTNAFNVPSQIWKLVNDSEEHSLTALDEIFHYHIMVSIPQYLTSETKFVIEDQMLDVFLPLSAAVEVDGVDITSRGILELDWVGKHLRFQFKDGEDISDLAGKTIQFTTETRLDLTKDLRPHYGVPIPNVATLQFTSGYPDAAEADAPQLLYSNVVYVNLPEIEISIAADKSVDRVTDSSQMIRTDGIFRAVGDEIYYQFDIQNTGNLPFTSLAIKDAKLGLDVVVDLSDTPLLPGDTYTYEPEAPYAVTSEDLDAETILNEATVTGTTPSGPTDPVPVEHETPGAAERRITAVKTAVRVTDVSDAERADNVFTAVGDKIYYRFEIVNEGTVSLTGLTVADEKLGLNVSLDLSGSPLLPGESYIYEPAAPYVVTAADLEAETVLNTATIAGTTPHGSTDPVLVEEETSGLAVRSIAAEKTAVRVTDLSGATRPDVVITDAGQGVYYRFEITNTGSVPLTGLSIADPKIGLNVDLDLTETPLLPGESYTYEPAAPYVVTAADMAEGMVINQATIIGLTPGGTTDPVLAEALTPAARSTPPPVDVPKTGEPQSTLPFAGLALLLGAAVTFLISRKRRQEN